MKIGSITTVSQAIDKILLQLNKLSLRSNFNPNQEFGGVKINAGETIVLSHKLRVVPYGRLILRQSGGGPIVDGDTWTSEQVSFSNLDASNNAIVTILILG